MLLFFILFGLLTTQWKPMCSTSQANLWNASFLAATATNNFRQSLIVANVLRICLPKNTTCQSMGSLNFPLSYWSTSLLTPISPQPVIGRGRERDGIAMLEGCRKGAGIHPRLPHSRYCLQLLGKSILLRECLFASPKSWKVFIFKSKHVEFEY